MGMEAATGNSSLGFVMIWVCFCWHYRGSVCLNIWVFWMIKRTLQYFYCPLICEGVFQNDNSYHSSHSPQICGISWFIFNIHCTIHCAHLMNYNIIGCCAIGLVSNNAYLYQETFSHEKKVSGMNRPNLNTMSVLETTNYYVNDTLSGTHFTLYLFILGTMLLLWIVVGWMSLCSGK